MNVHEGWTRWLILASCALLGVAAIAAVALVVAGGTSTRHERAARPATVPMPGAVEPGPATVPMPGAVEPGPPARPPPGGPEQFGVSVNRLFNDLTYSPAQIDAQLTALRATGATIARTDAFWEAAEPAAPVNGIHRYDWRFDDAIAAALAAHGLMWLPIIDYSAVWAESVPGKDHSPPSRPDDYAAYAAAFARRYGHDGTFWRDHPRLRARPVGVYEIWNEPDSGAFWFPAANAARYADLYGRARAAILAVQPAARAIVGGLSDPVRFLQKLLAASPALRGHIDGVGIHPYGAAPLNVLAIVRSDRAVLAGAGMPHVPLYVTEFGWTIRPPDARGYAPPARRPGYLRDTMTALGHVDCGVAMTIVYTWVTPEKNRSDGEDWFGIHSPSGGASVDSQAFAAGVRAARGARPSVRLCGG